MNFESKKIERERQKERERKERKHLKISNKGKIKK